MCFLRQDCGDIAKFVEKGQVLLFEGRLQTRSWEKDGKKFYMTEIVGESFQFGERSKKAQQEGRTDESVAEEALPEISMDTNEITAGDLPF